MKLFLFCFVLFFVFQNIQFDLNKIITADKTEDGSHLKD